MKSKVFYLLVVLLLAVAGCAENSDSSNGSSGGTQISGDGTLGGQTTAKFISRQIMVSDTAFYVYDTVLNTVTETLWNNTDFAYMKPFILNSEDAEEHIFFGENGIAYVAGNQIRYIAYAENASPKTVTLPEGIDTANYEIDDITLIGNVLYFQLEERRSERETYYRADVSKDVISAEVYTGDKTIMKVIDIDITVTTPDDGSDNTGDNSGTTGDNTGTESGSNENNTEIPEPSVI